LRTNLIVLLSTLAAVLRRKAPSFKKQRQAATEARATSAASSRLGTSANLGVELAWRYQEPRGHRGENDINIALEAFAYHHRRRPGRGFLAAEPRYQGARDGRCLGNQAAAYREHNYPRGGQRQLYSTDGQAVVSSRRNDDIKEQKTGVDLALKLPQIAPVTTTPGGRLAPRTAILRL